jgi:hypothetical protein
MVILLNAAEDYGPFIIPTVAFVPDEPPPLQPAAAFQQSGTQERAMSGSTSTRLPARLNSLDKMNFMGEDDEVSSCQ